MTLSTLITLITQPGQGIGPFHAFHAYHAPCPAEGIATMRDYLGIVRDTYSPDPDRVISVKSVESPFRGAVAATVPPPGWNGATCEGCRWPHLCRVLGPRAPNLPHGPCPAHPAAITDSERNAS